MRKPLAHALLDLDDVPMSFAGAGDGGLCCPDDALEDIMECIPVFDEALLRSLSVEWPSEQELPQPLRVESAGQVMTCGGDDVRPPPPPAMGEEFGFGGAATCGAEMDVLGAAVVEGACELDVPWSAPRAGAETMPSASASPETAKPWPSPPPLLFPAAPPPLLPAPVPPSPWPCAWTHTNRRGKRRRRAASAASQWRCPFPPHFSDQLHEEDNKHNVFNQCEELSTHINGDRLWSLPPAPPRRRVFVPVPSLSPDHHFDTFSYDDELSNSNSNGDGDFNHSAGGAAAGGGGARRMPQKRNRQPNRICAHCKATETPQWRAGPAGPGTLCNACGIRFKLHGELPVQYRPCNSDGFVDGEHSNRHKRVLKMRAEKEKEKEKALASLAGGDQCVPPPPPPPPPPSCK